jgi:hypothetical protein
VADHADESRPDSLPIQADGLYPITDLWHIEPSLDTPEGLRIHIAQFAREIAGEANLAECITSIDHGIGFVVCTRPDSLPEFGRCLLTLLRETHEESLLCRRASARLSDAGLLKFFRLLRLSRRLLDIEADAEVVG